VAAKMSLSGINQYSFYLSACFPANRQVGSNERHATKCEVLLTLTRQQLFDASLKDQVSRLEQDFLPNATSTESAQSGMQKCGDVRFKNRQRRYG